MKVLIPAAILMCAFATISAQKPAMTGDAEFKTLIDRYNAAWSTLNPENAAAFYAKDSTLVFYDLAPLKYNGWAEYEKGVRSLFAGFETLTLKSKDDLKVSRHGDVTWTTVTFTISAKLKNGTSFTSDGRHTAIWEKRGNKWVIVHEHVSAPLPG